MQNYIAQLLANNIGNRLTNELATGIMIHIEQYLKQMEKDNGTTPIPKSE